MKRIAFEVDDSFAEKFSDYCVEKNISKKSVILKLLDKEMDKGSMMEQYANINYENKYIDFMNEENYERLKKIKMEDKRSWMMRKNLFVNNNINHYFEKDETLSSLFNLSNLAKIEDLSIPNDLLDHYYFTKFNNNDINYDFEHLYGIMTFPYIDFEELKEIISSWNTKFWNLFIINPALMKYVKGSLGLFITPINSDISISEYNGFFKELTGYSLFYLWTDKKKIKPIRQIKKPADLNKWLESLTDENFPKMHKKIVKFWFENNDKIKCHALETSCYQFIHNMVPHENPPLMSLTLEGDNFEMINTKNKWSTEKCHKLGFDLETFNCIYVNDEEIVFTKEMLKDFKDGNFELKMI